MFRLTCVPVLSHKDVIFIRTVIPEWPFLDCVTIAFSERYIIQILSDQVPVLNGTPSVINWLRLIKRKGTEVDETGEDRWLGIARNSKRKERQI